LDEYIAIGLESSSASRNARRDQVIAEKVVQQARSIVLPSFSLGASYTRLDEVEEFEFGDETLELGTEDNYAADISVSQLLYAGGRGTAALKAGRLTREQARWSRVATESDLVLQIETLFSGVSPPGKAAHWRI
jgi:outer membrane protein TolC